MLQLIIIGCLITVTLCARLDNVYIPPGGRFLSGSYPYNAYNPYNNPHPGYTGGGYNANAPFATILRYNNQNSGDGNYHYE